MTYSIVQYAGDEEYVVDEVFRLEHHPGLQDGESLLLMHTHMSSDINYKKRSQGADKRKMGTDRVTLDQIDR